MRYHVLATDYDGTIALHGKVTEATIEALKTCKASSRKIILVTGRELDELIQIFPEYEIFDLIVAENGALIFNPSTKEELLIGERPPESFITELKSKNVAPLSIGRVIVATWEPHQDVVLNAIKNAGIEYQVIFNKGAVMVLPPGINKAKGLQAALDHLKLSMHNVVAVGDAQNDQAMIKAAECSIAVANALESLKEEVAFVTNEDHGAGVETLISMLVDNDLSELDAFLKNARLVMGDTEKKNDFIINPYSGGILISGSSGGGKSTITTAFLEALAETSHQFCIIDPEGDYMNFPNAVTVGDADHEPAIDEIISLLDNPLENVVVSLLGIALDKRPHFFNQFIARLSELRTKTGRPHWFILDEAHHLIPAETESSFFAIPDNLMNFVLITPNPGMINPGIIKYVQTIIAIGEEPHKTLGEFAAFKNVSLQLKVYPLPRGQAWVWNANTEFPFIASMRQPVHIIRRHIKKYTTGEMSYNEFYFRGPDNKLNLRAYNIIAFMQIAEGVDDDTWLYHLKKHDYSNWFDYAFRDDELSMLTRKIEDSENDPKISRNKIFDLIKQRYTL